MQALLIQVQKVKVDAAIAMNSIDKLLRSNELNFAFIAVAPTLLVFSGFSVWLRRVFNNYAGKNAKAEEQKCHERARFATFFFSWNHQCCGESVRRASKLI